MTITLRSCTGHDDFAPISDFLNRLYQPHNRDGNWFQPIWEYAYTHPYFDDEAAQQIGFWEDNGSIVGVAMYELRLGEAFFQVDPAYEHLKPAMLEYAEQHLSALDVNGVRYLKAYVNDFDSALEEVVRARGYEKRADWQRPMSEFAISEPFPSSRLPEGFRLKSLADDNDLVKVDRVLWRGFNHPGEPPADSVAGREKMQSGPHFRKDLAIVVESSNGQLASFAGLWFEPVHCFGYVEPVATDPDYRRMGLGTAAVLEGIRRCRSLGANVAYVGSDKPFYLAMGFRKIHTSNCWYRTFAGAALRSI